MSCCQCHTVGKRQDGGASWLTSASLRGPAPLQDMTLSCTCTCSSKTRSATILPYLKVHVIANAAILTRRPPAAAAPGLPAALPRGVLQCVAILRHRRQHHICVVSHLGRRVHVRQCGAVPWFSRSWLTKGDGKLQIVRLQKFGPYDPRATAHVLSRGCPGVIPHGGTLEMITAM